MIKQFYNSNKPLVVLILSLIVIIISYVILIKIGIIKSIPDELNVVKYDGEWFEGIRDFGYVFTPNQMSNMAFFPLFPYIWKWTLLNGLQISFVNLLVFIIAFSLLIGKVRYKTPYLMVVSTLPCIIFFFLPYSESWFFLFGTLLIIGYRKDSRILQCLGLFGCCLTRSVSTFFIPAVIITELLAYKSSGISKRKLISNIIIHILVCIFSIFTVVVVQGLQTGKWFYYIEVQKYWKRHWLVPSIPFTTVSPNKVLGIDAVALILGCVAIFFCLKWGYNYLSLKIEKGERSMPLDGNRICKSVYFSALFLSAIAIVDTCFTYDIGGRTNMQCMNRHLMCTSFAVCFLNWINKDYQPDRRDVYFITSVLVLGLFVTGVFNYVHHTIYYILFGVSFFLYKFFPKLQPALFLLFLLNVFFVAIFYQDFINGFWIG